MPDMFGENFLWKQKSGEKANFFIFIFYQRLDFHVVYHLKNKKLTLLFFMFKC